MLVRIANAYGGLAPLPGYDHHLIVSVHFRAPKPNGFPSSEEGDDLQAVELNMCSLLETGNYVLSALVVTNNGLRDFIFYTRDPRATQEKIDRSISIFKGFEVEFAMEPADDWRVYKAFSGMVNRVN
jgi:hypothetical protein